MPDEDTPWYVHLLVSLALLVGVAVLVVGIIGVFGLTAARLVGFPGSSSSSSSNESVSIPPLPTPSPPSHGQHQPGEQPQQPHHPGHRSASITLTASPAQVPVYGRIDLRGSYPAPDGTTLQVQRQETGGPWLDFPTTATVNGGSFSTYIKTSHTGVNRLRVTDSSTGDVSNTATVRVG